MGWSRQLSFSAAHPTVTRRLGPLLGAIAALTLIALATLVLFNSQLLTHSPPTALVQPPRSVAVLPFLDLTTEAMNEEYFADGMTEELIDKLARIPDLRVPPPTSSFYFKGKQVTVAAFAHSLGVAYVLDGSVRKSGATLRISARLVRAADGYVVWSETYDRPEGDKLWVQEDIADEVGQGIAGGDPFSWVRAEAPTQFLNMSIQRFEIHFLRRNVGCLAADGAYPSSSARISATRAAFNSMESPSAATAFWRKRSAIHSRSSLVTQAARDQASRIQWAVGYRCARSTGRPTRAVGHRTAF